jgi:hypothetical protein
VYDRWLKNLLQKYPNIDQYKIVFDGQKLIFTIGQPLPDIDEMVIDLRQILFHLQIFCIGYYGKDHRTESIWSPRDI